MKRYIPFLSLIIIISSVFYGFYSLMPRTISDASTPLTQFSTERALVHLKEISKKAHYLGTEEHRNVRKYIVEELKKLGLEVNIEEAEVFNNDGYGAGAKVYNIIAKIKGTNNSKALMLSTHYDSDTRGSLGASDAGSGVVTILEGIRAYLATGKKPKNDIIILITDAEELGLLGATAYAQKHNVSEEVGLILIFEARGSGGPSYMLFETNSGNKKIVEAVQKTNPKYVASTSLMYSISKMIPNTTDLTAFTKGTDVNGLSFAFIDDHFDYHTSQDSYERLDAISLEHQGTYLMPLLNYLADADISNLNTTEDSVYFNFPHIGIIMYSYTWIFPLIIICLIIFIGLVAYGIIKKKLNTNEMLKGFIPFFVSLIVSGLVVKYGWLLIKIIYPQYNDIPQGFTYNGNIYILGFSALTLAICFMFYKKYFASYKSINLLIAPLFVWILINIGVAFYLKGAAYFIVSVVTGLSILGVLLFSKNENKYRLLLTTLLAIPFLIILSPGVHQLPVTLGTDFMFAGTTFIVLLFGLFASIISNYKNFKLGRIFLGLALIAFVSASFQSSYSVDRKKPNGVNYVLNVDDNTAFWGSRDYAVDEFTQQFLGEHPEKFENSYYKFTNKADVKPIKQPTIDIKKDTIIDDLRHIDFSIISNRTVNKMELYAKNDFTIKNLSINGYEFKKNGDNDYVFNTKNRKWIGDYNYAYQDSIINISFSVLPNEKPEISLSEISYDLLKNPNFNIEPRKDYMMQNSYPGDVVDAIILVKTIQF
ncbi:M28 family peptidase [Tenacibaculum aiptasiae]|uniref:M28 family peptidase n=1 Tax=Tenacibaculum aiptasiae TaxID=426481 RepID=UPI003B5A188F